MNVSAKQMPTLADLQQYAAYLRALGYRSVFVWGEPGTIRWSRKEPEVVLRYCLVGYTGRIWSIIEAG